MTAQLLRDEWRTARNRHTCSDCDRPIEPGDRYRHSVTAEGGRVATWKEHGACHDLYWRLVREWGLAEDDAIDFQEFRAELDALSGGS